MAKAKMMTQMPLEMAQEMIENGKYEMLKEAVMFSDWFWFLEKEAQEEIYTYCKCNAGHEFIQENLKQIRYAATKLYFGE
jgi:hypothetical protein